MASTSKRREARNYRVKRKMELMKTRKLTRTTKVTPNQQLKSRTSKIGKNENKRNKPTNNKKLRRIDKTCPREIRKGTRSASDKRKKGKVSRAIPMALEVLSRNPRHSWWVL